jgi:hypothetical protein
VDEAKNQNLNPRPNPRSLVFALVASILLTNSSLSVSFPTPGILAIAQTPTAHVHIHSIHSSRKSLPRRLNSRITCSVGFIKKAFNTVTDAAQNVNFEDIANNPLAKVAMQHAAKKVPGGKTAMEYI